MRHLQVISKTQTVGWCIRIYIYYWVDTGTDPQFSSLYFWAIAWIENISEFQKVCACITVHNCYLKTSLHLLAAYQPGYSLPLANLKVIILGLLGSRLETLFGASFGTKQR